MFYVTLESRPIPRRSQQTLWESNEVKRKRDNRRPRGEDSFVPAFRIYKAKKRAKPKSQPAQRSTNTTKVEWADVVFSLFVFGLGRWLLL